MSAKRTQAASRRERERRARRTERLIVVGAVGALVVAFGIVLAGFYITEYRPPRAHVLTVGESDYNAGELADRATFELFSGGAPPDLGGIVDETIERIQDAEVLRLRAPALVGPVTEEDVDASLRERLGFVDSDDDQGFADALGNLLRDFDLSLGELEERVEGQILAERLQDRFREEVGESAAQVRLSRIRAVDRGVAEEVRELVVGGDDFAQLATERTAETSIAEDGGNLGWQPVAVLPESVRAALAELAPGEISEIVEEGLFFDIYLLAEREDARALEEEQIDALVARRLRDWLGEQRETVVFELNLSDGEERWILDRIVDNIADAQARAAAQQQTQQGGS